MIIVNFPSLLSEDDLHKTIEDMGYAVDNVRCLSHSKGMKLQEGKSLYAFVNMKDASSANSFKKACDSKKIVMTDPPPHDRKWEVSADWAKSNGRPSSHSREAARTQRAALGAAGSGAQAKAASAKNKAKSAGAGADKAGADKAGADKAGAHKAGAHKAGAGADKHDGHPNRDLTATLTATLRPPDAGD